MRNKKTRRPLISVLRISARTHADGELKNIIPVIYDTTQISVFLSSFHWTKKFLGSLIDLSYKFLHHCRIAQNIIRSHTGLSKINHFAPYNPFGGKIQIYGVIQKKGTFSTEFLFSDSCHAVRQNCETKNKFLASFMIGYMLLFSIFCQRIEREKISVYKLTFGIRPLFNFVT